MRRAQRRAMRVRSTGVEQQVQSRHLPESPDPGGAHQWVVAGTWRLSDDAARAQALGSGEEVHLDAENLLALEGPGCWVCEQVWSPGIAEEPCPGDPSQNRASA